MTARHPDCRTAGCMMLVPCPERAGCELEARHHWCPDEQGLCLHDAAGLSHECPAIREQEAA